MSYHVKKDVIFIEKGDKLTEYINLYEGNISKVEERPICSICKNVSPKNVKKCGRCNKYLCEECVISVNGYIICLNCLKKRYPLSRREYMVLYALSHTIDVRWISYITHISKRDVKKIIRRLIKKGFVSKKGYSIFSKVYVTDYGIDAIHFLKRYYLDKDFLTLLSSLMR
jgi:predicted transcriptional regulator